MKTIQKKEFYETLIEGINKSKELAKDVLVSYTEKIENIDPISFFTAGRNQFLGERFFWSAPSVSFTIVGIGHTLVLEAFTKDNPYHYMKEQWQNITEDAISYFPQATKLEGVGPLLLGGFLFDPLKEKTNLWADYSNGTMFLPTYMLTITDEFAFLTTNKMVNSGISLESIMKEVEDVQYSLTNTLESLDHPNPYQIIEHEVAPNEWKNSVKNVIKNIKAGVIEKVVLARELQLEATEAIHVEHVLADLLGGEATSYIFAVESGKSCFIGASPERLIKKQENRFFSTCLAGTIKRGETVHEDIRLGEELLNDPKNLHEHALVVEMIKEAMKEGCSEVFIPDGPRLYKARNIQHLYTPVVGTAKEHISLFDMIEGLHPTPALGGYPRMLALEEIRKEELLDRGWYGAPLGWIDSNGNGEFIVAIRSGLIRGSHASLFAGCGIVADSDPDSEYEETKMKLTPMRLAIGGR